MLTIIAEIFILITLVCDAFIIGMMVVVWKLMKEHNQELIKKAELLDKIKQSRIGKTE